MCWFWYTDNIKKEQFKRTHAFTWSNLLTHKFRREDIDLLMFVQSMFI